MECSGILNLPTNQNRSRTRMISRQAADDPNNGDDANNGDARIAALETENRELREQQQRRKQQSSTSPQSPDSKGNEEAAASFL
mmetsp:Transcript_3340/g.4849  ORF Transcript_3340/g.4849 Transcript_3340/m.4849 type:complete len:84 (+) Transcript_3340:197-448(+)